MTRRIIWLAHTGPVARIALGHGFARDESQTGGAEPGSTKAEASIRAKQWQTQVRVFDPVERKRRLTAQQVLFA